MKDKPAEINRAEREEPHSRHKTAVSHGKVGASEHFSSSAFNEGNLGHATAELHAQHPIAHDDHGPHHGADHHSRHEPHVMPNSGHHHHKK